MFICRSPNWIWDFNYSNFLTKSVIYISVRGDNFCPVGINRHLLYAIHTASECANEELIQTVPFSNITVRL